MLLSGKGPSSPVPRAGVGSGSPPRGCSPRHGPGLPSSIWTGRGAEAAAELGPDHRGFACDVTDPGAAGGRRQVLEAFGQVDILLNNAGVTQPVKIMEITGQDWHRIIDVNLSGVLYLSQAFIPHMRERKQGSIVCMSSVSAQRGGGIFGGPHYSAAKAGVLGLAKAMARELGARRHPGQLRHARA